MNSNVLIAVLLAVGLLTPTFGWLFYAWYRSHMTRLHQRGQIFDRRNLDRAQANYEPENGLHAPVLGPYFTSRGWVRPKNPNTSYALRPPKINSMNTRGPRTPNQQPKFVGNARNFQGRSQMNGYNPPTSNQQPNPLSKRQQKKQRALQNKQRQQEQSQNQQWNNNSQQKQKKQKKKNKNNQGQGQGQDYQASIKSGWEEGNRGDGNGWADTEPNNDQRSVKSGGGGWGNEETPESKKHHGNRGQSDNGWAGYHGQEDHQNGRSNSRNASRTHGGWDQSDNGERQNSPSWNNDHHEEKPHRGGWNDDDYKPSDHNQGEANRHGSPERQSRGRSSPNRDWNQTKQEGFDDKTHRSNSWGRGEERGGGNQSWSQDGNAHGSKKKKKERWEIELEANEERSRGRKDRQSPTRSQNEQSSRHWGRSPSREKSDSGWGNQNKGSGWKDNQEW